MPALPRVKGTFYQEEATNLPRRGAPLNRPAATIGRVEHEPGRQHLPRAAGTGPGSNSDAVYGGQRICRSAKRSWLRHSRRVGIST